MNFSIDIIAESDETDDIIIESYVCPSSKGQGKGVKISAEFYKYAILIT